MNKKFFILWMASILGIFAVMPYLLSLQSRTISYCSFTDANIQSTG